jgi:hypothetical protein
MPPKKTAGNMNEQVKRGQAPKSIDRVDPGNLDPKGDRMSHIHFKDGRHAIYNDGTWKHGGRPLTNEEKEWIEKNGWPLPKD